ncbi:pyridoxamine 5'-phosphate oxidase family protein [Ruegeria sp. HKCCD7255]|uniref:FAD-binding oxidoreductase n=1 Tax=Ruegeria sp. HKCCD7255 TaxID=2683004 RepID=UPI001489E3D0|nr:pyridoxamine 5'-phosphate oxidase family protein [Ruegeria sp. HKCCD7255]
MALSGWDKEVSPYHPGEIELHSRLGRQEKQEKMGRFIHRPYMPDQHREFFAQLPFFIGGSVDSKGWPWASILFGNPGFVSTPDDRTLSISGSAVQGDPYGQNAVAGSPVSYVGIELPTRRRNRVNGVVRHQEDGRTVVDVVQSYGNCPQYIHTRKPHFTRDPLTSTTVEKQAFTDLDDHARAVITKATTFFVASHNPRDDQRINGGVDVNHRGGNPGFVKVEGNTLTIPDFIGNFAFNTLGNFLVNPKAGLLFIDFNSGDLIQLTGKAELLWDKTQEVEAFKGAERAWRFHLDHGHRLVAASPLRFDAGEASPNTRLTGDWVQAQATQEAEAARKAWRPFRVTRIVDESSVIRSFYLEPADDKGLLTPKPGQYLTIRARPEGWTRDVIRTYTLSSSPSDGYYRISVKREEAKTDAPSGAMSTYLHETLKPGDTIDTRAPNGRFCIDTAETRPAVLIGAGVGITPLISMARQVVSDGFSRRHLRPLTVFHAARTTAERAFVKDFTKLRDDTRGALRYVSVISRPAPDEKAGRDFHFEGRLTPEILQSLLPLADYDFFLCGPPAFMQTTHDMLLALGVPDARIQAEAFGPAAIQRQRAEPSQREVFIPPPSAMVRFAKSKINAEWTPKSGSLLDLAEAQGLTPNYGCKSGNCGSCAVRLLRGSVGYPTQPEFPLEEGEALICCAVPADETEFLQLDL